MDRRRAAGALLALAAFIACTTAAPMTSNQTTLDLYEGATEGCYYNFQHYGEGDRIMTNEPCLNCTCHNRMLMCYLRVCPFTKPIGQDCTVEKRADQCCPIITCPDVPVDLLTSTSTTSPAEYGTTGVGKIDKYGCTINGRHFSEGSKVPSTPNKPCEHCYCIRNMTTCVMQECTLHVDGCTPIYHKDVCCPVRYSCDHLVDEIPLLDDMTTTVRPTPGFLLTTTTMPASTQISQECMHDDQVFADGALIKTEKACEHCYCMKGDIVCVVQECGMPMENEGKNCTSLPPRQGQCCPDTYICEGNDLSSDHLSELTTEGKYQTTATLPPRRGGVEGSGYRNEPDEPYTDMPHSEISDIEGSGEDQAILPVEDSEISVPEKYTPDLVDEMFVTATEVPQIQHFVTTIEPEKDTSSDSKISEEVESETTQVVTHIEGEKTTEAALNVNKDTDITVLLENDQYMQTAEPDISDTKVTEGIISMTIGYDSQVVSSPDGVTTKEDKYGVTTEPAFRKEDGNYSVPEVTTRRTLEKATTINEYFEQKVTIKEDSESSTPLHMLHAEEEQNLVTEYPFVLDYTNQPKEPSEILLEVSQATNSIETTTINVIENEINEEFEPISSPGRIPGEGDCLLNGITYKNNTTVPSANKCHTSCKCVSSIVQCDPIICSPPPEYVNNMNNCQPIYDTVESCCPTYVCDHFKETIPPESHSQMSGTESPKPIHGSECRDNECKETLEPSKRPMQAEKPVSDIDELCDKDSGCQVKPIKPCEGENCEQTPELSIEGTKPICDNLEECEDTKLQISKEQISCTDDTCTPQINESSLETQCNDDNCRRKEIETKLPSGCVGDECEYLPTTEESSQKSTSGKLHDSDKITTMKYAEEEKSITTVLFDSQTTESVDKQTNNIQQQGFGAPSDKETEGIQEVSTRIPEFHENHTLQSTATLVQKDEQFSTLATKIDETPEIHPTLGILVETSEEVTTKSSNEKEYFTISPHSSTTELYITEDKTDATQTQEHFISEGHKQPEMPLLESHETDSTAAPKLHATYDQEITTHATEEEKTSSSLTMDQQTDHPAYSEIHERSTTIHPESEKSETGLTESPYNIFSPSELDEITTNFKLTELPITSQAVYEEKVTESSISQSPNSVMDNTTYLPQEHVSITHDENVSEDSHLTIESQTITPIKEVVEISTTPTMSTKVDTLLQTATENISEEQNTYSHTYITEKYETGKPMKGLSMTEANEVISTKKTEIEQLFTELPITQATHLGTESNSSIQLDNMEAMNGRGTESPSVAYTITDEKVQTNSPKTDKSEAIEGSITTDTTPIETHKIIQDEISTEYSKSPITESHIHFTDAPSFATDSEEGLPEMTLTENNNSEKPQLETITFVQSYNEVTTQSLDMTQLEEKLITKQPIITDPQLPSESETTVEVEAKPDPDKFTTLKPEELGQDIDHTQISEKITSETVPSRTPELSIPITTPLEIVEYVTEDTEHDEKLDTDVLEISTTKHVIMEDITAKAEKDETTTKAPVSEKTETEKSYFVTESSTKSYETYSEQNTPSLTEVQGPEISIPEDTTEEDILTESEIYFEKSTIIPNIPVSKDTHLLESVTEEILKVPNNEEKEKHTVIPETVTIKEISTDSSKIFTLAPAMKEQSKSTEVPTEVPEQTTSGEFVTKLHTTQRIPETSYVSDIDKTMTTLSDIIDTTKLGTKSPERTTDKTSKISDHGNELTIKPPEFSISESQTEIFEGITEVAHEIEDKEKNTVVTDHGDIERITETPEQVISKEPQTIVSDITTEKHSEIMKSPEDEGKISEHHHEIVPVTSESALPSDQPKTEDIYESNDVYGQQVTAKPLPDYSTEILEGLDVEKNTEQPEKDISVNVETETFEMVTAKQEQHDDLETATQDSHYIDTDKPSRDKDSFKEDQNPTGPVTTFEEISTEENIIFTEAPETKKTQQAVTDELYTELPDHVTEIKYVLPEDPKIEEVDKEVIQKEKPTVELTDSIREKSTESESSITVTDGPEIKHSEKTPFEDVGVAIYTSTESTKVEDMVLFTKVIGASDDKQGTTESTSEEPFKTSITEKTSESFGIAQTERQTYTEHFITEVLPKLTTSFDTKEILHTVTEKGTDSNERGQTTTISEHSLEMKPSELPVFIEEVTEILKDTFDKETTVPKEPTSEVTHSETYVPIKDTSPDKEVKTTETLKDSIPTEIPVGLHPEKELVLKPTVPEETEKITEIPIDLSGSTELFTTKLHEPMDKMPESVIDNEVDVTTSISKTDITETYTNINKTDEPFDSTTKTSEKSRDEIMVTSKPDIPTIDDSEINTPSLEVFETDDHALSTQVIGTTSTQILEISTKMPELTDKDVTEFTKDSTIDHNEIGTYQPDQYTEIPEKLITTKVSESFITEKDFTKTETYTKEPELSQFTTDTPELATKNEEENHKDIETPVKLITKLPESLITEEATTESKPLDIFDKEEPQDMTKSPEVLTTVEDNKTYFPKTQESTSPVEDLSLKTESSAHADNEGEAAVTTEQMEPFDTDKIISKLPDIYEHSIESHTITTKGQPSSSVNGERTEKPVLVDTILDEMQVTEKIIGITESSETVSVDYDTGITVLNESKPTLYTSTQVPNDIKHEYSETTPFLVELEEHTHKALEETSPNIYYEVGVSTPRIEGNEEISSEKIIDLGNQTEEPSETEMITKEEEKLSTFSDFHFEASPYPTNETVTSELPEKLTKESILTEFVTTNSPVYVGSQESTTTYVSTNFASEHSTSVPLLTTKYDDYEMTVSIKQTEKPSLHEVDNTALTEKESILTTGKPHESEMPFHATKVPEEEYISTVLKTTTSKIKEDITTISPTNSDKLSKPEEGIGESVSSSSLPEIPKPGYSETQPTDDIASPEEDSHFPPSGTTGYGQEPDYVEEDQAFGPGTCRYGGKVYVSAQQIPRDDPCDFCFCFRSDIICLQQSCPPPIHGCHEEPIQGFCCPRYECPVSMATTLNITTTTTTTTTTLPPHFLPHAYKGAAQRRGCQIKGHTYRVGEVVRASSGPCLHCTCGGDGQMKCDPKVCTPEPMLRQMIAAAVSSKRRR